MNKAITLLALTLCAAVATPGPAALADGDPASDTLVSEDVFFPYNPPTNDPFRTALVDLLEQSRSAGFPMKVALIQTAADLGAYPQMFNDAQTYANLLSSELPTPKKAQHGVKAKEQLRLLVVMPSGFAGQNLGEGVDRALDGVKINTDEQSDGLARAALQAIPRLAQEEGVTLETPAAAEAPAVTGDAEEGKSGPSPLVFIAPLLLVLVGAGLAGRVARNRSQAKGSGEAAGDEPASDDEQAGEPPPQQPARGAPSPAASEDPPPQQ